MNKLYKLWLAFISSLDKCGGVRGGAALTRPGSDMMLWVRRPPLVPELELVKIWDWDMKLVTSASPELENKKVNVATTTFFLGVEMN